MVCVLVLLAGCAVSSGQRAPIIDHSYTSSGSASDVPASSDTQDMKPVQLERMQHEPDWRPQAYVVQKGDTLYSIAFNFGFDYHDLAELNGLPDPTLIKVGQEIRLFPAPVGSGLSTRPAGAMPPSVADIKEQPLVSKLPFSERALADIGKMQAEPIISPEVKHALPGSHVPAPAPAAGPQHTVNAADETIQWEMPTAGKVVASFSENDGRKGIDIAGNAGQPISASAPGKVVYSGTGLRGYGKLVIIKHNNTYLSAYAHNRLLMVKEGQMVAKGQKIAEMGNTDSNQVALHFEIRRLGKPVDPAQYLLLPKS